MFVMYVFQPVLSTHRTSTGMFLGKKDREHPIVEVRYITIFVDASEHFSINFTAQNYYLKCSVQMQIFKIHKSMPIFKLKKKIVNFLLQRIETRIAVFSQVPKENGEPMQVLR